MILPLGLLGKQWCTCQSRTPYSLSVQANMESQRQLEPGGTDGWETCY